MLADRKLRYLIWSYILAACATVVLALLVIGASAMNMQDEEQAQGLGFTVTIFVLVPSIIGASLASAAKRGQCASRPLARTAIWWNGILIALYTASGVIGLALMLSRM